MTKLRQSNFKTDDLVPNLNAPFVCFLVYVIAYSLIQIEADIMSYVRYLKFSYLISIIQDISDQNFICYIY